MLLGNVTLLSRNPLRYWGQTLQGERGNWNQTGPIRNSSMGWASVVGETEKAAIPSGYLNPAAWMLPNKGGGIASRGNIVGTGALTASGAMGLPATAALTGAGDLTATGQLVVSGTAALTGTGTLTGSIVAVLPAVAALTGSGALTGTMDAEGFALAALSGSGSLTVASYARGFMEADITNIPAGIVTPGQILDDEFVETGLTVREALKIIAAATAGKVSGASTTTVVIRNAVADDTNRITATVDSSGNRTAITYDLT